MTDLAADLLRIASRHPEQAAALAGHSRVRQNSIDGGIRDGQTNEFKPSVVENEEQGSFFLLMYDVSRKGLP
jgi:hypothetical protein